MENQRATASVLMYSSLSLYSRLLLSSTDAVHNTWWLAARDHPRYLKCFWAVNSILLGTQPKGMQHHFENRHCGLCNGEIETAEHVLFNCEILDPVRNDYWERVVNSMPIAYRYEVERRTGNEKIFLLLSPLGNTYTKEWGQIYCNIAMFVHAVYEHRHVLYGSMIDPRT